MKLPKNKDSNTYILKAKYTGKDGYGYYGITQNETITVYFDDIQKLNQYLKDNKKQSFGSGHGVMTCLELVSYKIYKIQLVNEYNIVQEQ